MFRKVTIYCVEPYWWDGRRLARSDVQRFRTREEAEREARRAYAHHAGVSVYSISGWPDSDAWESPRVLNTIGYVLGVD
jgi:hypothetical protein